MATHYCKYLTDSKHPMYPNTWICSSQKFIGDDVLTVQKAYSDYRALVNSGYEKVQLLRNGIVVAEFEKAN